MSVGICTNRNGHPQLLQRGRLDLSSRRFIACRATATIRGSRQRGEQFRGDVDCSQSDNTKSATASIYVLLPHSVSLRWGASSSTDAAFYRVYLGTVSRGPSSLLNGNIKATAYTDSSVQSGNSYYLLRNNRGRHNWRGGHLRE